MTILDKAKSLTNQVAEKAGDLGGDELIVNTIIRAVDKHHRVNRLLEEKECDYRVSGIDVELGLPPKVAFSVARESE
jgi:hypothetical protein